MTNGVHAPRRRTRHPVPERRLWLPLLVTILLIAGGCAVGLARAQEATEDAWVISQEAAALVPTPTATPEPEPTRYAPASRGGRDGVRELAERHFPPAWVPWAVRVAGCESSFDLGARSSGYDARYGYYAHVGPWQISAPTWAAKAWELFGGPLEDPDVNAAMAAWILARSGPGAWPYCSRFG